MGARRFSAGSFFLPEPSFSWDGFGFFGLFGVRHVPGKLTGAGLLQAEKKESGKGPFVFPEGGSGVSSHA